MTSTARSHQGDAQHCFEERLVKLASSSLAENLLHTYPHSGDQETEPDQEATEKLMKHISFDIRRRKSLLEDSRKASSLRSLTAEDRTYSSFTADESESDMDLIQRAQEQGFLQWKEQASSSLPTLLNPAKKKPSQMSLFLNQFNSGGGSLQSFMSWDRIQEESQGDESVQLKLLANVQHLHNILPDWESYIKPFFLQSLRPPTRDVIDLHRKWFDQSRHSTEFRSLQIGLCENLITAIEEQSLLACASSRESEVDLDEDVLRQMMDVALDMFEDWMLRGIYVHDERVWSVGRSLWSMLFQENDYEANLLTPAARCMIQVDGEATWFSSWFAHLSPDHCLDVVSIEGLSNVISWCHSSMQGVNADSEDTCFFWVSIIHSIIVSTRVSRFPWQLVKIETNDDNEKKLLVFHMFLNSLEKISDDTNKMELCADGIETVLLGCHDEPQVSGRMTKSVKELQGKVAQEDYRSFLLQRTLTHVEKTL